MILASVSIDTEMFVIEVSWQVCTYMSCALQYMNVVKQ